MIEMVVQSLKCYGVGFARVFAFWTARFATQPSQTCLHDSMDASLKYT
jgi:hypothetical protein